MLQLLLPLARYPPQHDAETLEQRGTWSQKVPKQFRNITQSIAHAHAFAALHTIVKRDQQCMPHQSANHTTMPQGSLREIVDEVQRMVEEDVWRDESTRRTIYRLLNSPDIRTRYMSEVQSVHEVRCLRRTQRDDSRADLEVQTRGYVHPMAGRSPYRAIRTAQEVLEACHCCQLQAGEHHGGDDGQDGLEQKRLPTRRTQ